MYLLKLETNGFNYVKITFTFHHVSIKTGFPSSNTFALILFTFHHVSIKTQIFLKANQQIPDSHSTMYLLKHI